MKIAIMMVRGIVKRSLLFILALSLAASAPSWAFGADALTAPGEAASGSPSATGGEGGLQGVPDVGEGVVYPGSGEAAGDGEAAGQAETADPLSVQGGAPGGEEAAAEGADGETAAEPVVPDGTYLIRSAADPAMGLDVAWSDPSDCAAVQLWPCNGYACQVFSVRNVGDGLVVVANAGTGKLLDVAGGRPFEGAQVWQFSDGGWDNQRWLACRNADGTFSLLSAADPSFALSARAERGSWAFVAAADGSDAQRWVFAACPARVDSTRTVADGVYEVGAFSDGSCVLDVPGSSDGDCPVQMYSRNGLANQRFSFEMGDDGFYTVRSMSSGKALDACMGSPAPGTAVNQYVFNGGDNQKWAVRDNLDGSYSLVAKTSGLVLDIVGVVPRDGAPLQLWDDRGYANQRFSLSPVAEGSLPEGVFAISPRCAPGKVLDIDSGSDADGANCQIFSSTGSNWQKFQVREASAGLYSIQALSSGQYLADVGGEVVQMPGCDDSSRLWAARQAPGGTAFVNAQSGLAMDVRWGASDDLTDVQSYPYHGGSSQMFSLVPTSPLSSGTYQVASAVGWRVLDVAAYSRADGANVQLWSAAGTGNQKWCVEEGSDGTYSLRNCRSKKMLDVAWSGSEPGTNVWQWTENGYGCQKWILEPSGDGWYFVKNVNGLYLDMCAGDFDGVNVQLWTGNRTDAQRFDFQPTTYDAKPGQEDMEDKAQGYSSMTRNLILVNLTLHKVGIFDGRRGDWELVKYWDCTNGAPSTPTVVGEFTIGLRGYYFDSDNCRCFYWTQFFGDYLFHSVLYYQNFKYELMDARLGLALSHGCVRLALENAYWIYQNIPARSKVVIYY